MNCPICGKEITEETLICDGCGDMSVCRIQSDKLDALRESAVPETLKPFRSTFAAVYAGLTSLILVFSVMTFIAYLRSPLLLLVCPAAAVTAVVAGISAYGCWRSFFAGPRPLPHFRAVGVLPAVGTYILTAVQIFLFIMVFVGFIMLIGFAASSAGDSAAAETAGASSYGRWSEAIGRILLIELDNTALGYVLLAIVCMVGCVIVGGLAGSFNRIRKQYAALTGFTRGKNEAPAGTVKAVYVYVWSAVNAACSLLCFRDSFGRVCIGLLWMFLALYAILSVVMLRLTARQAARAADELAREQTVLDSLTERTERVAAYRAYRSTQPAAFDDAEDDDTEEDDTETDDTDDAADDVVNHSAPDASSDDAADGTGADTAGDDGDDGDADDASGPAPTVVYRYPDADEAVRDASE